MQPKKREITKKNVSVPVLFLYFKSYLYKTLIYSVLSYIKITFSRLSAKRDRLITMVRLVVPRFDCCYRILYISDRLSAENHIPI